MSDLSPRAASGLLLALLTCSLGVRLLWLEYPGRQTIVDEGYYISAAHKILRLDPIPGDPYPYKRQGQDPVIEHPIGGKLLIIGSIQLFGNRPFAWRLPAAIFGTAAVLLTYLLAVRLGGTRRAALVSASLIALDPMMLANSRLAMIEMFYVTFVLAGLHAYVAGRPVLSGTMMAAAVCSKLTGVLGIVALGIFALGKMWIDRRAGPRWSLAALRPFALAAISFAVLLPALLWVLNSRAGLFRNPFDNLFYMYTYAAATLSFQTPADVAALPQSRPWEWLLNQGQITYIHHGVFVLRGLYNPMVIFATAPIVVWAVRALAKYRSETALMILALVGAFYVPFLVAAVQTTRHTYLYYFMPVLPAVALGVGAVITSPRFPASARLGYLVAAAGFFVYYFPFRGLP